jgi:hypothetical protein
MDTSTTEASLNPLVQFRVLAGFLARIDRAAKFEGLSRSAYLQFAVLERLDKTEAAQRRAAAAADYAVRKANVEGAPL